jgi:hypothetical protein
MANLDMPRGFACKGVPLRVNKYVSGAAVYPGDLLIQDSTGRLVACATGGTEFTGAAIGVSMSYASAAAVDILVADHPDQLYLVQSSVAGIDAQTNLGLNYSVVGTTGNTTYKTSRQELKGDSGAVTATLTLKALGLVDVANNAFGDNGDVIVKINNHQLNGGTGSAGV